MIDKDDNNKFKNLHIGRRILYLILSIIGFIAYGLVQVLCSASKHNLSSQKSIWAIIAAIMVIGGLYLLYYAALQNQNEWNFEVLYQINWKNLAIAVIGLIVILLVQITLAQTTPIHHTSSNQQVLNYIAKRATSLFTIMLVLIAPICEELIFRGMFYQIFFTKPSTINIILGSIINGIVFALIHQTRFDVYFLMYWFTGVVLSIEYLSTKNISTSIITHIGNNLVALL